MEPSAAAMQTKPRKAHAPWHSLVSHLHILSVALMINADNAGDLELGRCGSKTSVHPKPLPDHSATIALGFQVCSAVTGNYFTLNFTRANVHRMMFSASNQHISREIISCAIKYSSSHQKCPTFIPLKKLES